MAPSPLMAKAFGLCLLWHLAVPQPAHPQGLAQVNLAGIPPVLPSPMVSDIAMGFEQGRFPMTFIFNSPDRQPTEFVFRVQLEREGQTVLDLTSDAALYTRGVYTYATLDAEPPITFSAGYRQIIEALGAGLDQDLEHTGLLSEGLYTITVEALPTDPDQLVIAVPGLAVFSVQYLEPPVLMSPSVDAVVTERLPLFTWLPVIGGPPGALSDYEFLLVEVYPEQVPTQAIESNRPLEQRLLTGMTTLPYTADLLPLEAGKVYAWQVTARDADGTVPFTDSGRSEISTFTYAPATPALAEWTYPFSQPHVIVNLSDAELTSNGYLARGFHLGAVGAAPVPAFFDDVLLDAATLEIRSGRVVLLGETAGGVGLVESDASRHLIVDDSGPATPFVTVRTAEAPSATRLSLVISPSEDPESGIRAVEYRLVDESATDTHASGNTGSEWDRVYESDHIGGVFPGGSYNIDLPDTAQRLLRAGRLALEVRVRNGLGLETDVQTSVGSGSDVSPPVVVEPALTYTGYYDTERPNSIEISEIQASDAESNIRTIEYRITGPTDGPGAWTELAAPASRSYRTPATAISLPEFDEDTSVLVEFRVTNQALLSTSWTQRINVDIDETQPVLVGPLARFVTSETDPRIEILRDAVADYQSGVPDLAYRVVDDREPTRSYLDWAPFPPGPVAEVKRTQLNFTTRRAIRVEVSATNGAGLESTFAASVVVPELAIGDRTPPTIPSLTLRVVRSEAGGETVLELAVGPSSDPETGVSRAQYRMEDASNGAGLTGWVDVGGIRNATLTGSTETVVLRLTRNVQAIRAVVRLVNGAGGASTTAEQVSIRVEDTTPPDIREVQAYTEAGRILVFIDGLADLQSTIARVDYRLERPDGTPLTDWTTYPLVPAGRPSYGRQLLRAEVPQEAGGSQILLRLRAVNGSGLETIVEETVRLER